MLLIIFSFCDMNSAGMLVEDFLFLASLRVIGTRLVPQRQGVEGF